MWKGWLGFQFASITCKGDITGGNIIGSSLTTDTITAASDKGIALQSDVTAPSFSLFAGGRIDQTSSTKPVMFSNAAGFDFDASMAVSGGKLTADQLWLTSGANMQPDAAGKLIFNNHPGFLFNEGITVSGGGLSADTLWLTGGANIQPDATTGVLHFNNNQGFVFGSKVEIDSDLHVVSSTDAATPPVITGGNIIADQNINAVGDIYTPKSIAAAGQLYASNAIIGNVNGSGWVYTNSNTTPYQPGAVLSGVAGYDGGYKYPGINGGK